jgi:hypothetical protein
MTVALAQKPDKSSLILRLEAAARRDPGGRGLATSAPLGLLEPAAQALLAARRVIIVTGFCVRSALRGESDGPPGATALAAAFSTLGAETLILSDRHSGALVAAACAAREESCRKDAGALAQRAAQGEARGIRPDHIQSLPDAELEAHAACRLLAAEFRPDLVLAVERPGGAVDGHRYSMRGAILDDIAPPADELFPAAAMRCWATAAIGDGGNELGMGSLKKACVAAVPLGERIFCAAAADYPIVSGISNWGAYALAGALSILIGRPLIASVATELAVLRAVCDAGAVDGCTGERSFSVDGLPAEAYGKVLREMYDIVLESL